MDWIKVIITTTSAGVDMLPPELEQLGIIGCQVQDPADFQDFLHNKTLNWDYMDDQLLSLGHGDVTVTVYLADTAQGAESLRLLANKLNVLKAADKAGVWGSLEMEDAGSVAEEDWSTSWKQYYHPTPIGEKLLVCPSWERCDSPGGRVVITLDPGMAFGTGTHESTALCLSLLEEAAGTDARLLDIGTGSGILAIAGLLLGAREAIGIDIDAASIKVAAENAALNGVDSRSRFIVGNLAEEASGQFDIICANIVADVIIALLPQINPLLKHNGSLILSGIIDARLDDVLAALDQGKLKVCRRLEKGGWVALLCGRKGDD